MSDFSATQTPLVMIRHGETDWNAAGRIQGWSDVPLSDKGRAEVAGWRVPREFDGFSWVASPLTRAQETAGLLGASAPVLEPRIREMHWGEWEGFTIEDIRAQMGAVMREREAKGLDFCAPGGESPRDVQARLGPWLAELAEAKRPTIAVAHKGVIRALYALATGWDMRAREPVTIDWTAAQLFHLDAGGQATVARLNVTLVVDVKVAP